MKTEDFKALTPYQQSLILILEDILVYTKATYQLLEKESEI
jgi:hypothetical protein